MSWLPTADWPIWLNVAVFAAGALVILAAGTKLAKWADQIADRTGMGEAFTGVVFLGLATALPGVAASVTAAADGLPTMSVTNAMGGIAAQTVFLALADIVYRKANLEHAAASISSLVQTALLIGMITLVILAMSGPQGMLGHVHVATPMLLLAAGFGLALIRRADTSPMWAPKPTRETVPDEPEPEFEHGVLSTMLWGFVLGAAAVLIAGCFAARAAGALVESTGADETLMGGLFLAVATSLPELVTTIAAVRRGALTLAIGDIVGGNIFDVLFVCFADLAYLRGSIYHDAGPNGIFVAALAITLNILLLLGLLDRQKRGIGNIGFESALIILVYLGGMTVLSFWL